MGNYCIKQFKTANSSKPLERTALTAPGCTFVVCFVEIKISFQDVDCREPTKTPGKTGPEGSHPWDSTGYL